jgi:DNA repair exonuclease SbcCD ATPase subunit
MIEFKSVSYKNFQSVGNQGIKIELNRSPTTLIGGRNGAGKSTFLEAISYGLFGKPLKKVTLGGLINSINKKSMLVEVEFYKNGHEYKIIRGQKPNKLEFYVDGEMLDQSASSKDYQTKIEYVIGMDYKLFTQIVVLNKEKYVPFMELSAGDRRKVVEDILDISVFSVMSDFLKDEARTISNQINDLKYDRERLDERIKGQQRLIDEAASNVDQQINDINIAIDQLNSDIDKEDETITSIKQELTKFTDLKSNISEADKKKKGFEEVAVKFNTNVKNLEVTLNFFKDNDVCPTCDQPIDDSIKNDKHVECTDKIESIKKNSSALMVEYQKVLDTCKTLQTALEEQQRLNDELRISNDNKRLTQAHITSKQAELTKLSQTSKVDGFKDELKETEREYSEKTSELEVLTDLETVYGKCKQLLKDDGIKASIVRDYIEFINVRVNEYMAAMDFYLNITLDESFNDKINSVNRDGFTYDNLSTGQKTRVNLAIWLALLEVASLKNSVVTNILFLDEILENLDQDGVSMFMKLVKDKLPHKNTFVVTQRFDEFRDNFRSELQFNLKDGFTELL